MRDRTSSVRTDAPKRVMDAWVRRPNGVHVYESNWLRVEVFQLAGIGWFFDCGALALDTMKLDAVAADPAKREAALICRRMALRYFRALEGGLVA